MHGFCEKFDIVSGVLPANLAAAASTGDAVSLKDYGGCVVVFFKNAGVATEDPTITLAQATDVAFGTTKALTFTTIYTKQATVLTATGTWTKVTQTAAATYTEGTSGESAAVWVIEFNAEDLDVDNGYDCLRATLNDVGDTAQYGCILYLMTKPRYPQATLPSAIID